MVFFENRTSYAIIKCGKSWAAAFVKTISYTHTFIHVRMYSMRNIAELFCVIYCVVFLFPYITGHRQAKKCVFLISPSLFFIWLWVLSFFPQLFTFDIVCIFAAVVVVVVVFDGGSNDGVSGTSKRLKYYLSESLWDVRCFFVACLSSINQNINCDLLYIYIYIYTTHLVRFLCIYWIQIQIEWA